jgi:ribose/xylose/arabinose/galactoside ABC-type transport system permease subunit
MSFTIIDKIISALQLNPLINDTIKGLILLLAVMLQLAQIGDLKGLWKKAKGWFVHPKDETK